MTPAYSFVMHTRDPFSAASNDGVMYAELAVGLGETLASGNQAGAPYKFSADVSGGSVQVKGLANYSKALGTGGEYVVDYTKQDLTHDLGKVQAVAAQLAQVAGAVQTACDGKPQDIEGALVKQDANGGSFKVILVQTRP